jgi:predicted alpha/beta superfamily hydrolase
LRLPDSFTTEREKRYPTLYLLDAQWNFELLHRIVSSLVFDQAIPEVLVVGITYAGESPDYDALRRQDYLPTTATAYDGKISGGDARQFLEFLEKSVIPMAERDYRADPETRILSGASYGGLFVLYALFDQPNLFNGYFAMSPSVSWDDRRIFQQEQAFRQRSVPVDAHIWLSVGSAEWPEYVEANQQFFGQMKNGDYRDAHLVTRLIEGEAHAGNLPEAHTRSLRFFFEDWLEEQKAASSQD